MSYERSKERRGRKRKAEWAWLEGTRVYFQKGRYVVKDKGKEIYLCPGDTPNYQVLLAWNAYFSSDQSTVNDMVSAYLNSHEYQSLAEHTRTQYATQLRLLCEWFSEIQRKTFGEFPLRQIDNKTIQKIYDKHEPNVARNRRFKILKACYSWARQRFDGVSDNPVVGLKFMKEIPRDRYIKESEYQFIFNLAPIRLQLFMEAAYLLRLCTQEIRDLQWEVHVLEHGVLVERTKGSWDGVVTWSERLENWVEQCRLLNECRVTPWMIPNKSGGKFSQSGVSSMWRRVWAKAEKIEGCPPYFKFHDIKAEGITDHPDKEGGHKSPKMKLVYDREQRLEKPTR